MIGINSNIPIRVQEISARGHRPVIRYSKDNSFSDMQVWVTRGQPTQISKEHKWNASMNKAYFFMDDLDKCVQKHSDCFVGVLGVDSDGVVQTFDLAYSPHKDH